MTCKDYQSKYIEHSILTRVTLVYMEIKIVESSSFYKNCWYNWENTTLIVLELKLPDVTLVSYLIPFEWLSACLFLENYFCGEVTVSQSFLTISMLVLNIWKDCCQNVYRTFENDLYSIYIYLLQIHFHIIYISHMDHIYIPILYIIHRLYIYYI